MATRRQSQLTIGFDPLWSQQFDWDVPLEPDVLTAAFPASSRNYIDLDETVEDIEDCTGEDLLFELVTATVARLNIDMDFDPDVFSGIAAFAYGVALTPTGGTTEVQTETTTATGGTKSLTVQVGSDAQTTATLAFDADAIATQAALDALSNVAPLDIVVSGTYVYTFSGPNFEKRDVNLITVNTFGLTGGTSTIATTTPGIGKTHLISRLTGYTLPLFTLYVGFRGSDEQPVIFKNVVVNSFRVRSASREKVTAAIELIGSGDLVQSVGYTMPECLNIFPLRFGDCKMSIGGTDYIAEELGREFEYYYSNDVNPKFDGAGIYATRHERADTRPSQMQMFVLGEPGDPLHDAARVRTNLDAFIQCGPDGRHVKFIAPAAIIKLAPTPIRFGGDPAESEIAVICRPKKTVGNASTPSNVVAVIGASTVLLPLAPAP